MYNEVNNINQYSSIMQPVAYTYKEGQKSSIIQTLTKAGYNFSSSLYVSELTSNFYLKRYQQKLPVIEDFYRSGMSQWDTFLDATTPNATISVFTYAFSVFYYYEKMEASQEGSLILSQGQMTDLWSRIRKTSRSLFKILFDSFQQVESQTSISTSKTNSYMIYSCILAIGSSIIFLGVIMQVNFNGQLKIAYSLILKVDKFVFKEAELVLSQYLEKRISKNKDKLGTPLRMDDGENDRLIVQPHLRYLKNPEETLNNPHYVEVKRQVSLKFIKKQLKPIKNNAEKINLSVYTNFVGYPKRKLNMTAIILCSRNSRG